ncbi:MAG: GNAT family N-acetyltransferase [Rhizobiaceae bacterium]
MPDIQLRSARKSDAADLAILDNMAGHGISLWFWQKAVTNGEGDDALEIGRMRFADDDAIFGWKNAAVALRNGDIAGSVTSYVMPLPEPEDEQFKREAAAFSPIFELFDLCVGDWFLDSLGVYRHARGLGVGSKLVDDSLSRGKNSKAIRSSLVVEDSNVAARKIYEDRGYAIRDTRPFIEFNGPSETREWLLMTAEL